MTIPRFHRRRWFNIGFRGLLLLIAIIAVGLGGWIKSAREQREIVALIRATASYAIKYDDDTRIEGEGGLPGYGPRLTQEAGSWWPIASLDSYLGRDLSRNVVEVRISGDAVCSAPPPGPSLIAAVVKLPHLRLLALPTLFCLTDGDARQLSQLTSLRHLRLSTGSTQFTDDGLRALGKLTSLETLEVQGDFTDDGLPALAGLVRLDTLSLGFNRPDGKPPARLTGRDFASLANLVRLRSLDVRSSVWNGDGMKALGTLSHLEDIQIREGIYTDEDLRHLAALPHLNGLALSGSSVDGTGFRHLSRSAQLFNVGLAQCPNVTDAAIPSLERLPALAELYLAHTNVTIPALERFQSEVPLKTCGSAR